MEALTKKLLSLCLVGLCILGLYYFYYVVWFVPERIRRKLRMQGIGGPKPSFPYGNISEMKRLTIMEKNKKDAEAMKGTIKHDYRSAVFPYYEKWRKEFGPVFAYRMGKVVIVHVSEAEVLKEICLCVSLELGKGTYLKKTHEPLFGQGILKSNGPAWLHQRKLIAPQFFLDKVKGMVDLMVDSTNPLLKSWERKIEQNGGMTDIKIDDDLRTYSADVISLACFGSSYVEGKEIFMKLRVLQKIISKPNMLAEITGLRYLPTRRNREAWRLNREIHTLILKIVKQKGVQERNLLSTILQNASMENMGTKEAEKFIVDNCKSIFFAGHESTAVTATWCLMLLGMYPEWQKRVRAEVHDVCGGKAPDAKSIQKMKTLTMVIQEALRLYPPGAIVLREALQEIKLGSIIVPKGVNVCAPVATLHYDPNIWGKDVNEFNPERFANGLIGACRPPHMYLPFGAGARTCLGQNFAMMELKIVLSTIISKFKFSLSTNYRHSPVLRLIVEPEYGVNLVLEKA
ncbi:Cytochrome P450 714B3 [Rhynchospora pubera]|uniref:Cytochrome P450 714B3 n=1 Tax=Rhynchospora pubera TaxID=906938 RepID=A0AAV8CEJ1_9POAL|nr:Cytochrome P450 714B3 [Rhynchospora pubera]